MATLSASNKAKLQDAIDLLEKGTALELPLSEDVVQRVAPVAESIGFSTVGGFYEAAGEKPISTLLKLALAIGA